MNDERFAMKLVGDAKFHLRKKIENIPGALPVIEIPYMKWEMRKAKEIFAYLQQYAEANYLKVSFVKDDDRYLRWETYSASLL